MLGGFGLSGLGGIIGNQGELSGETKSEWINVSNKLTNDWKLQDKKRPIEYKILNGVVYFRGVVKGGKNGYFIKGLPVEIRPKINLFLPEQPRGKNGRVNGVGGTVVLKNGSIKLSSYAKSWTSVSFSYPL